MLYAIDKNNKKIMAEPGKEAFCPLCNGRVIAKCGWIKVWHWAHETSRDCDLWAEPLTDWHVRWQEIIDPYFVETRMGEHRADIITLVDGKKPMIVELQHSPISPAEIVARENFYPDMIWLFDATEFAERVDLNRHVNEHGEYYGFRWRHPRKSYKYVKKPMFWDMGGYIFNIKRLYTNERFTGWGIHLSYEEFINRYLSFSLRDEANVGQKVTV